jgi:hypothetical protein
MNDFRQDCCSLLNGDMFSSRRRTKRNPSFPGNLVGRAAQVPSPQRLQRIAREDDPLTSSAPGKMFDPTIHGFSNFCAKSKAA